MYINQLYQLQASLIKNNSEYLKLFSNTVIGQIRDILDTKNMLIAKELSKYIWKLEDVGEKPSVKWNMMPIVNWRPKGGVCRICLLDYAIMHICYAHLASMRFKHYVCDGSLTTTYIYIYIYI